MAAGRKSDFTLPTLDDLFSSQAERDEAKLAKIRDIPLTEIDDFPNHPFKVRDDEDMVQLIDSIKERGVITPAMVRQKDDGRYHNKVMSTSWCAKEELSVSLKGLNLDAVWQNIIVQIGDVQIEQGKTLEEQLVIDEKRAKLIKEIDKLEKLARAEKQPKKKFELVQRENELKQRLEGLTN